MSVIYSIKDLEKLCGIKAHTLRIWEKRYGIINPKRTEKNVRYFLDDDLKHILNIALLNRNGHKISKIAEMQREEISKAVKKFSAQEYISEKDEVEAIMIAILEMDERTCNVILNRSIDAKGFENCIDELIYPLLDKLGVMWISGSLRPIHESFIRTILKNKVCSEIDRLKTPDVIKSKFLIYLPEEQEHELSLLFLEFILKNNGASVMNIGKNININDLIDACEIYKPDFAFTIISDKLKDESLQSYVDFLSRHLPGLTHLFTGFQFVKQDVRLSPNCKYVENLNAVEQYI